MPSPISTALIYRFQDEMGLVFILDPFTSLFYREHLNDTGSRHLILPSSLRSSHFSLINQFLDANRVGTSTSCVIGLSLDDNNQAEEYSLYLEVYKLCRFYFKKKNICVVLPLSSSSLNRPHNLFLHRVGSRLRRYFMARRVVNFRCFSEPYQFERNAIYPLRSLNQELHRHLRTFHEGVGFQPMTYLMHVMDIE